MEAAGVRSLPEESAYIVVVLCLLTFDNLSNVPIPNGGCTKHQGKTDLMEESGVELRRLLKRTTGFKPDYGLRLGGDAGN